MLQSFKANLVKTIDKLITRKQQLTQIQQSVADTKIRLEQITDKKSIQLLFSVLQNDFDLEHENVQAFLQKILSIKAEIVKDTGDTKQIKMLGELPQQNQFLRELERNEQQGRRRLNELSSQTKKMVARFHTEVSDKSTYPLHKNRKTTNYIFTEESEEAYKALLESQKDRPWQHSEVYNNLCEQLFQLYQKLPLGLLKDNSFEDRSLSYKTLNYQKVIFMLEELGYKTSAQQKLIVIKILKKYAKNIRYIAKDEFKRIMFQIEKLFRIREQQLLTHIENKKNARPIVYRKNNLDRSYMVKNQDEDQRRIASEKKRIPKLKLTDTPKAEQSYHQNAQKSKQQKLYIETAIEKMKIKYLTWDKLYAMNEASIFQNITLPIFHYNQNNKEQDSLYLQQFVNPPKAEESSPEKFDKYGKIHKMKVILPNIVSKARVNSMKQSEVN